MGYPYDDLEFARYESDAAHKTYSGTWFRLDYLFLVDGAPGLVIEAKASASDFERGFGEGKQHAINYTQDKKEFQGRVTPYLIVAAGERVEMFEAYAAGLTIDFKRLERLLSWEELCEKVRPLYSDKPPPEEASSATAAPVFANIFEDVFESLKSSGRPKFDDEAAVTILNELLLANIYGRKKRFRVVVKRNRIPRRVTDEIQRVLGRYDLSAIEGAAAVYAYRQFVTAYFKGVGSTKAGAKELIRTGRYLTPVEIIEFMVRLSAVKADDHVIDPACGSGGFLGRVISAIPARSRERFVKRNLVGCEIDPFCAEAAKTFVELLLPGEHPELNVYHHNGLNAEKWRSYPDISSAVRPGYFDLVISNPPANAAYSGGADAGFVAEKLGLPPRFGDGEAFLIRAMDLCAPDGRLILVVPDGVLANTGEDQSLRNTAQEAFLPQAIVSLPRVFPHVTSKMSVLYLAHVGRRRKKKPVFMARVELGVDPDSGEERVLASELDAVYDAFRNFSP